MPVEENKRLAEWVEEQRRDARDAVEGPNSDFYDLEDGDNLIEVKTTSREVANPNGNREGRYQLEETNHRQLLEADGIYDFVLRDADDAIEDVTTLEAAELEELIDENNREWPENSKLKIRWSQINDVQ